MQIDEMTDFAKARRTKKPRKMVGSNFQNCHLLAKVEDGDGGGDREREAEIQKEGASLLQLLPSPSPSPTL